MSNQASWRARLDIYAVTVNVESGKDGCLARPPHNTLHAGTHTTAWMQQIERSRKPEPRAFHSEHNE